VPALPEGAPVSDVDEHPWFDLDREAMYETLDKVLAVEPEGLWYQGDWISLVAQGGVCRTAGCFAGWRVMLDGYTELVTNYTELEAANGVIEGLRNPVTGDTIWTPYIAQEAMFRLGLTVAQSNELFAAENSLEDLKALVDKFCAAP
jgi:hypothetical protein